MTLYNQPVKGHNGVFTAKATKKPNHKIFWLSKFISDKDIIWKSVDPT